MSALPRHSAVMYLSLGRGVGDLGVGQRLILDEQLRWVVASNRTLTFDAVGLDTTTAHFTVTSATPD